MTSTTFVLVADTSCSLCSQLGEAVQRLGRGKIGLSPAGDPDLPDAVRDALGAQMEPLLYSSDGSTVTIWRGVRLRLRLMILIGPGASLSLLRELLAATTSPQTSNAQSAPASAAGGQLDRRQFLGKTGSLALGAAALGIMPKTLLSGSASSLTAGGAGQPPASWQPVAQSDSEAGILCAISCF